MSLLFSLGAIAASGAAAKPGMVLLKPTSVDKTGGSSSATIGTNGQVTFTTCATLSLNGVFSATYDNYVIALSVNGGETNNINIRLRVAGSDATGANYTRQYVSADSTSVSSVRLTSESTGYLGLTNTNKTNLIHSTIFGPFLAQPTAWRTTGASSYLNAYLRDEANTHSLSTSYDGFTIQSTNSGTYTITGTITVYGLRS